MKQFAENNKVGICHSIRDDGLYVRRFAGGYPYIDGDETIRASNTKPIYSYAKNYKKNKKEFALFVWSTESDQLKINDLFDLALTGVTKEQIAQAQDTSSFLYIS